MYNTLQYNEAEYNTEAGGSTANIPNDTTDPIFLGQDSNVISLG